MIAIVQILKSRVDICNGTYGPTNKLKKDENKRNARFAVSGIGRHLKSHDDKRGDMKTRDELAREYYQKSNDIHSGPAFKAGWDARNEEFERLTNERKAFESGLINLRLYCLSKDHKGQEIITHWLREGKSWASQTSLISGAAVGIDLGAGPDKTVYHCSRCGPVEEGHACASELTPARGEE